jgi:hypothetical protein
MCIRASVRADGNNRTALEDARACLKIEREVTSSTFAFAPKCASAAPIESAEKREGVFQ